MTDRGHHITQVRSDWLREQARFQKHQGTSVSRWLVEVFTDDADEIDRLRSALEEIILAYANDTRGTRIARAALDA